MSTTAPLGSSQAEGTPRASGAGPEQDEESRDLGFANREEGSRRRGGNTDNQGPVAETSAGADLTENAVRRRQGIGKRLKDFIRDSGQGLKSMYGETEEEQNRRLEGPIVRGEKMAKKLITEKGCTGEVAKDLSVLTLYDVAILIDDSDSMIWEEGGERRKTLAKFIDHIRDVCSMANESGVRTMRFLNRAGNIENWTEKQQEYLGHHSYGGLTKIGTELKNILEELSVGNPDQSKPLLVLIFTDGVVEGERKGHLKNVIRNCLNRCEDVKGPGIVAFQFSRIGNDLSGARLLEELDEDPYIGDCIDVFNVKFDLKSQLEDEWFMVPKILVGAILPDWDKQDDHRGGNKEEDGDFEDEWAD